MKNIPTFSIVVPIYMAEAYLDKCIKSLVEQTYSDIEIILVDDGSPDGCGKICDEYAKKDTRIKVIHKENGGVVSARQAGTAAAVGEYITGVDSDDWISADYFEKFNEIVNKYNPDIICCGAFWVYEKEKKEVPCKLKSGYYSASDIADKIFPILIEGRDGTNIQSSIWGKVFKRNIFAKEQLAVNSMIKIAEDHACVKPSFYHCSSMYVMDECLYYYRQNNESMTKEKKARNWNEPLLIARQLEQRIDMSREDFAGQLYRYTVHALFNVAVSQFHKGKPYKVTAKEICTALKEPYYSNAVSKADYKVFSKGWLARCALKHRLIFLMWLYSKL